MPTTTFEHRASIAGYDLSVSAPITKDAETLLTPEVPVANAATSWTYGSASTGTAVLAAGHGLTTGNIIDLYWTDGYRYGMTATVTANSVALSDGAGDDCPASLTDVILAEQAAVTLAVVGNNIGGIMATGSARSLLCLVDGVGTVYPYELDPGSATTTAKALDWSTASAGANPWTDQSIVSATASSSNTTAPTSPALNQPITLGFLYDSTTGSGS